MAMSARRAPESLDRLPVLTEVVKAADAWERADPAQAAAEVVPDPRTAVEPEQLEDAVFNAVQQHIDLMFEYRLREAIAPALARAADQLIKDLREPLAADLRDVAQRAVAQELARRRTR